MGILPYPLLHKAYALVYSQDNLRQIYDEFIRIVELINIDDDTRERLKNLAEIVLEYRTGKYKGVLGGTAITLFINEVIGVFERLVCNGKR